MRDASLERTPYGSLLDSPAFGAFRDRGTTRGPTIPRQGSGRRVSSRLSVTRTVTAEGQPFGFQVRARKPLRAPVLRNQRGTIIAARPAKKIGMTSLPNSGIGMLAQLSEPPPLAPLYATVTEPLAHVILNSIRSFDPNDDTVMLGVKETGVPNELDVVVYSVVVDAQLPLVHW